MTKQETKTKTIENVANDIKAKKSSDYIDGNFKALGEAVNAIDAKIDDNALTFLAKMNKTDLQCESHEKKFIVLENSFKKIIEALNTISSDIEELKSKKLDDELDDENGVNK